LRALARVMPGVAEVAANPRARSAVLRVAERRAAGDAS
jgi:16S rRNA (cytosine1402-N4)-methyltransferase